MLTQKHLKLDNYEKSVEKALSRGDYRPAADSKTHIRLFKEAAKNYHFLEKSKPVTLRINLLDLLRVKAKAKKVNIPYQTLINSLIHRFAEDRISI